MTTTTCEGEEEEEEEEFLRDHHHHRRHDASDISVQQLARQHLPEYGQQVCHRPIQAHDHTSDHDQTKQTPIDVKYLSPECLKDLEKLLEEKDESEGDLLAWMPE